MCFYSWELVYTYVFIIEVEVHKQLVKDWPQ